MSRPNFLRIHTTAITPTLTFFFSSRRRHTRWPRDWSSDVCSSDLRGSGAATEPRPVHCFRGRQVTTQCVTANDGWTGFQGVHGDDAAAILDTVDVPIVVLRRDLMLVCFNKAAAGVLRLSPSDIGRASRDISVLAGLPR